jgi:hypothetical protein
MRVLGLENLITAASIAGCKTPPHKTYKDVRKQMHNGMLAVKRVRRVGTVRRARVDHEKSAKSEQ